MSTAVTSRNVAALEEVERDDDRRPPFILTWTEVKLLGIAGVGFFLDAYDLFIINPVSTMLQYRLYGGHSLPTGLEGFIKASANIGSVVGQILFGYLGDSMGRKAVYGKELMLIILATILTMTTPTGTLSPNACLVYLGVFRILLGIGVGGDYPMSASVTSDRSRLRKRGVMLNYIFSNQGWGSFVGSIATMIVLACYKHVINDEGKVSKVDGVWRIIVGLSLIPAVGTLYQRLTLAEATRYIKSKESPEAFEEVKKESGDSFKAVASSEDSSAAEPLAVTKQAAHFTEFIRYFSEWRHAKLLIGTSVCWFLLDIAFYGINLNQNVVLQQIGFDGKQGTAWERIFKISTGNLIITALGFVPGYYASILTIEYVGRKPIQLMGFILTSLFLGVLAGKFHDMSQAGFIVCFTFLQFFFNFGANTTTFIYPAEIFPTRYKAFAHGISAASGKCGAIISSLAFNTLSKRIGTPAVLWIFFGCNLAGFCFTFLLPESKGRDPDVILAEEIREAKAAGKEHPSMR